MGRNKPKLYTEAFKKESVSLALNSEQSVLKIAKDLGLSGSTLHGWIKRYSTKTVNSETSTIRLSRYLVINFGHP